MRRAIIAEASGWRRPMLLSSRTVRMPSRTASWPSYLQVAALAITASIAVARGQTPSGAAAGRPGSGRPPQNGAPQAAVGARGRAGVKRTPSGDPDLEGVWNYGTMTPLARPAQ